jgi:uncharacterized protein (DUF924 family)
MENSPIESNLIESDQHVGINSSIPPQAEETLRFWFGDLQPAVSSYPQRRKVWFGKHPQLDQEIRDRFQPLYEQAAVGNLDDWQNSPLTALALIVLLDQFPRNMFRNTPKAFATDAKALAIAQQAIAHGFDQHLTPIQRIFLYVPLEHSENLEHQRQCVALFQQLFATTPDLDDVLDYAQRHYAVIDRFGRFPHRNEILGRSTTPEEAEFLKQPGSRF